MQNNDNDEIVRNDYLLCSSDRLRLIIEAWQDAKKSNALRERPIAPLDSLAEKRIALAKNILFSRDLP